MPLAVLGLIVIIAVALLIYYSTAGKSGGPTVSDRNRAREHQYEKSEDGKVVFLYNRNKTGEENADDVSAENDKTNENADKGDKNDTGDKEDD